MLLVVGAPLLSALLMPTPYTAPPTSGVRHRASCVLSAESPDVLPPDTEPPEAEPPLPPGTYVNPYSMALGVSFSAVLCSELVVVTGTSGALLWGPLGAAPTIVGRLAGVTTLPLLLACLLALRNAAFVGSTQLDAPAQQRLNLAVAACSILAIATPPRPDLTVIVARAGTALLCFEVWSKSLAAGAGDMVTEAAAIARGVASSVTDAFQLATGLGPQTPRPASRGLAACAIGYGVLGLALLAAPVPAAAALWPHAVPGMPGFAARRAAAWAVLSSSACLTLAADDRPAERLSPASSRVLSAGLFASAAAHLAVQGQAATASRALLRLPLRALAVQLLQLGALALGFVGARRRAPAA